MATPKFAVTQQFLSLNAGRNMFQRVILGPFTDLAGAPVDLTAGYTQSTSLLPQNINPTNNVGDSIDAALTPTFNADGTITVDVNCQTLLSTAKILQGTFVTQVSNDAFVTHVVAGSGQFQINILTA